MSHAMHASPRRSRRRLYTVGAVLGFVLVLAVGMAAAAVLKASVGGSVKVGGLGVEITAATLDAAATASNTGPSTGSASAACPTAAVSNGALTLTPQALAVMPGEGCIYNVSLKNTSDVTTTFTGLTGTLPADLTASVMPTSAGGQVGCDSSAATRSISAGTTKTGVLVRIGVAPARTGAGATVPIGSTLALTADTTATACTASVTGS